MRRVREELLTATVLGWVLTVAAAGAVRHHALDALAILPAGGLAVSGYLLRRDPDQRRTGRLLWLAAAVSPVADLGYATGLGNGRRNALPQPLGSWVTQLGHAGKWWAVVPLAAVLLSYPGQRIERRWHRRLLQTAALVFVVVPAAEALAYDRHRFRFTDVPYWMTLVPGGEGVRVPLAHISRAGGALVAVLGVVAVISRWRAATGPTRTAVRSIAVVGAVLCVGLAGQAITAELDPWRADVLPAGWESLSATVTQVTLAAAPLVLLLEALRRRGEHVRILDRLLAAGGDPAGVQQVLAAALEDPDLRLAFALDGRWIDPAGQDVTDGVAAGPAPGRTHRPLTAADGNPMACLDLAAAAAGDTAQLATVLRAAGVVLDNTRLQAALAARLREVATSRARIVEAGLAERRRVERDLHDGAQQQLLAVTATLARAGLSEDNTTMRAAVDDARQQLSAALAELRRLARGIHPAVLSQGGLPAALRNLADTAPIPVHLDVPRGPAAARFTPAVESTAWFIAAESVANAVKHAGCSHIGISLHLRAGTDQDSAELILRITDDGAGGATPTPGGGLAGLRDRAAALGGTLTIRTAPGGGTTIESRLPCAS